MTSSLLDIFTNLEKHKNQNQIISGHRKQTAALKDIANHTKIDTVSTLPLSNSNMTLSSSFSNSSATPPKPSHVLSNKTKNILINTNAVSTFASSGGNNKMARSIEIDHLKNNRMRVNHVKLTRPITLLSEGEHQQQQHQIRLDLDQELLTKLNHNRIKVRLLIFVEDADGSRSNIFDSAKHTQTSQAVASLRESKKLSRSVINAGHNGKLNSSEASSLPSNKIQINKTGREQTGSSSRISNQAAQTSSPNSSSSTKLNNEMITRMVFGSFPMLVSNRTAIKVHSLK